MDTATIILALAFAVLSIGGLAWASYVNRQIRRQCDELEREIRESRR